MSLKVYLRVWSSQSLCSFPLLCLGSFLFFTHQGSSSPFSDYYNDNGEERPAIWSPGVLWDQFVEAFRVKRFPDLVEKAAKIYCMKDLLCMWEIERKSLCEKETFVVSCIRECTYNGYLLNLLNEMTVFTEKCDDLSSKSGDPGSSTRFLFHPQHSFKNVQNQSNLCWLGLCCICTFKITFRDDLPPPSFFVLWHFHFHSHLLPDPFQTCFT